MASEDIQPSSAIRGQQAEDAALANGDKPPPDAEEERYKKVAEILRKEFEGAPKETKEKLEAALKKLGATDPVTIKKALEESFAEHPDAVKKALTALQSVFGSTDGTLSADAVNQISGQVAAALKAQSTPAV